MTSEPGVILEYEVLISTPGGGTENFVLHAADFNHAVTEAVAINGGWQGLLVVAEAPYSIAGPGMAYGDG